jgi:hypothetical protein
MVWLALGGLILFLFLAGLRAFEQASVASIKSLLKWIAALAVISLALLLILTGRGGFAIGALTMFGPLIWSRLRAYRMGTGTLGGPSRPAQSPPPPPPPPPPRGGAMTPDEAYQVLGLKPGATDEEIRAAHHRLMRSAHPDSGGSDWLAARVNLARDVLLGRGGHSGRRA